MQTVSVESLDQEGRGIAHVDGKVVFIEGALPGESVTYSPYRKKATYEFATVGEVVKASALRTEPRCKFFGRCGGCSLQHFDAQAQVAVKQRVLEDNLRNIGKVAAEVMLPAIHGPAWGYRERARLSVRYVVKKGGTLVGFRERRHSYVADMTSCQVLPPHVSALLEPLRHVLAALTIRERLPQIEVAVGEGVTALVLRVLQPLTEEDRALLHAFSAEHGVRLYLQPRGPDSVRPFAPEAEHDLYYALPEFDLKLCFSPTEFTQVNMAVNRVLVRRARPARRRECRRQRAGRAHRVPGAQPV
jgi:23S rRNA (uracil1939-C5)-methyltransferase